MSYYNSEEEFLSVYTKVKLVKGGKPVITKEELTNVRDEFLLSEFSSNYESDPISNFNFSDLQAINERFQNRASKNCNHLKPCFNYKNGKLYPTYAFYDFTETTHGEFLSFFGLERYKHLIPTEPIKCNNQNQEQLKPYLPNAKKVADYITETFAQKYIDKEVELRRWPIHMQDTTSIFTKDLGKALELPGTKANFQKFNHYAQNAIAVLLKEGQGNLMLSDCEYGNLEFNNLKRILSVAPVLENLCTSSFYKKGHSKFNIAIKDGQIKCNERTLVDYDPYGDFSDEYSVDEKQL